MANERQPGRYMTLDWKTNKLGGIKSLTLNIDSNTIDVSDHDSGRWTNYLTGRKDGSIDFTCNLVMDNTAQTAVTADILAADSAGAFSFKPNTTKVGDQTFTGTGILSNVSIEVGDDDVIEISGTITITGEITRAIAV